ncbi:MAG: extracellular solute-binding protein [Oscillospiraceae bacterium]|nr:extracellular solute-binding protein [Oscillospiraceae bacterium]
MKKTFKRIVTFALAAVMVLGLVACGGGAQPRGDENQTEFLIVGGMSTLSSGNDSNPVLMDLAEKAGVEIEWDLMSDSLGEKVGVLIGGMQLPDAFIAVNFSATDINDYGADGTFIDLTGYITPETMPNLSAILEKHPEIKSAITQADGCIYGLPSAEMMGTAAVGASDDMSIYSIPEFSMINKTWLDELGLAVPTNLTELHDALVAFRDNDMATRSGNAAGSTIPMSTGYDQWCWGQEIFYSGFGFTNFTSDVCADLVANPDGTVEFVSATDKYRDAVTYFHDWYAEGLMDLEMFSQSTSQLIAKVSQGRVGVTTWWYIEEIAGEHADDFVFLPPMYGPEGTEYANTRNVTVRAGTPISSGNLNITSACGNPELLCKYFDQWYDPEVVMQLQYAPIGIYFTEKDASGVWQVITEEAAQAEFGKSSGELKGQYEVYGPRLILPEYYNSVFYMEDRATERLEDLMNEWMPYVDSTVYYPADVTFTNDELETISRFKADFTSQVAEYEGTWLKNGGPTDDEWNAYLQMLEDSCGMSRLLDVYQSAYNRYMGK